MRGDDLLALGVALGLGLMLGVERERRMRNDGTRGFAGVRTFALVALLGGLASRTGGAAMLAVAGAFVGASAVAGYLRSPGGDIGMTTEIALFVAFLLGALAQRHTPLAAGAGVAVALVLAYRDRLHHLVGETLSDTEVHDALLFAAAALIVLPLVPNKGAGPNGALNPSLVWKLVVLVMAVQGFGYVLIRMFGARYGFMLSGAVSGLVSSTATIAAMGSRATQEPAVRRPAVAGAVVSTDAALFLLAAVLGATSPRTLERAALPLLLAGAVAIAYSTVVALRVVRMPAVDAAMRGRAFDLRTAVILAVLVSLALLGAGALNHAFGRTGVAIGAAVAGFADSQSPAAAVASLVAAGRLPAKEAILPVLAALSTSTVSKGVVAYLFGKSRFGMEVSIGLALLLAGAWTGWLIAGP